MKDIQQLIKKNSQEGRYEDIFPKTYTDAVKDKESGKSLIDILSSFNMYFLSYNGSREQTRLQVPMFIRKTGLWITYVLYDKTVVTEWYAGEAIDDDSWKSSDNWRVGSNMLVGDISISSDGYWMVNGVVTTTKAQGEQGITPMLRVGSNNHLQVSYTNGSSWVDASTNPVYTQFRVHDNKLEQSVDLGATWIVVSDELAYQFRNSGNKLQVSKDLGVTWEDTSDYIAAWFKFTGTTGSSQADNVGKIQISRDNGVTWSDLSGEFTNSLHIKGYVATVGALPSSAVQGDIYGVGPTYDPSDTTQTNPIYQLYVKDSTGWVNNGKFTSIAAGVVQTTGTSTTEVMSQNAVTTELESLRSDLGIYSDSPEYIRAYTDNEGKFLFGIKSDGSIEWAKGIPTPIKDIIDSVINTTNQKLLVVDGISKVENPEYIYVITDDEGKILFSIDINGKIYPETGNIASEEEFKYLSKPKTSIFPCSDILQNHIGATPEICYDEYYERCKDAGLVCSRTWSISQDYSDKYIANFIKYWGKDKTTESSIIYCQNPYLICDINSWYTNDMKNPLKDAEAMTKWKHHIETLAERYNGVTEFTPTNNGIPLTDSPITFFQKYWDEFNEPMGSAYRGKDKDGNILMTEEEVIQMMKPYYECIKKHNQNSVVLSPSHDMVSFQYVDENDFFNKMLSYKFIGEDEVEHRAWEYFDAIGIHYYHSSEDPEKMMKVIGELQSLFYKYYLETGDKKLLSMPIYIGETNHPELARQLIIEQALGIEKSCIWKTVGEDTEDKKLFNSDGTPTDRYYKVKALNKMMPEGSTRPTVEHDENLYFAHWLDDCGIPTVAIWATKNNNIIIEIENSGICRLYNYLAEEIDFDNKLSKSITVTSSIIYCKNANNFKYKLLNK